CLFCASIGLVRNPTGATHPPVIPSVERGTWVGGDAYDVRYAEGRAGATGLRNNTTPNPIANAT
ncbi:MAG: hypothetical protein QOJ98_3490, partial [Acidobacteriota bacterium]|nr:hypothetical protein [Acidobacteriota bacterium]